MTTSAINLSPLVSGSRQVNITLEEGTPVEFDPSAVVATAAYSRIGVATRLRLVAWTEDSNAADEQGIAFLKAASSTSGNSTLIPLPREGNKTGHLELYHGEYSSGTSSILISSSRQSEKCLLSYDPITFSSSTVLGTPALKFVYSEGADFGGVGWATEALTAEIVLADVVAQSGLWLCVRKDSALNVHVFAPAFAASAADSSNAIRLSTVEPVAGLGWTTTNTRAYVSDVSFGQTDPPVEFSTTVPILGDVKKDIWVAYSLRSLASYNDSVALTQPVSEYFFGSLGPTSGTVSIKPLVCVSRVKPLGAKKRLRVVLNAEEVFGNNDELSGGVYSR
jgi:hypothetical protein